MSLLRTAGYFTLLASAGLLSACHRFSSSGSSSSGGTTQFTAAISPEGANVEPEEAVVVRFSEPVDAATLSATTFVVSRRGEALAGEITPHTPDEYIFRPEHPFGFAPLGRFRVELSADIRSAVGNRSLRPESVDFAVRDGVWSAGALIETLADFELSDPRILLSERGSAVAIWRRAEGSTGCKRSLASAVFDARARAWSTPTVLSEGSCDPLEFDAFATPDGSVLLVWVQEREVRVRRYDRDSGSWGPVEVVDKIKGTLAYPLIAALVDGPALLTWTDFDSPSPQIMGSVSFESGAWESPQVLGSFSPIRSASPGAIAVDPRGGSAMAGFALHSEPMPPLDSMIATARFSRSLGTWQPIETVAHPDFKLVTPPKVQALGADEFALSWVTRPDAGPIGEHSFALFEQGAWVERSGAGVMNGNGHDVALGSDGSLLGAWFRDHPANQLQLARYDRAADTWSVLSERDFPLAQDAPRSFRLDATREDAGFVAWNEWMDEGDSLSVLRFTEAQFHTAVASYAGSYQDVSLDSAGRGSLILAQSTADRSWLIARYFR